MILYGDGAKTIRNSNICPVSFIEMGSVTFPYDLTVCPIKLTKGALYGITLLHGIPICLNGSLKRTFTELPVLLGFI